MLSVAVLLTAFSAGADQEVVHIRIWPAFSFEPANALVHVSVERDPENRLLTVSGDSGEFFRRSDRPLDGESGPRTSVFYCRDLPAGDYEVTAQIFGRDGRERAVARRQLRILPR